MGFTKTRAIAFLNFLNYIFMYNINTDIINILRLRRIMAYRDLKFYLKKDSSWNSMKDQARGSYFETTMTIRVLKNKTTNSFRRKI